MRMLKYLVPLGIFLGLCAFFFKGLYMDPRALPSALIAKPMPAWELSSMFDPNRKLSTQDMKGKVWLLNVWATWCVPCRQEHPVLVNLKRMGSKVPVIGFLYKDNPQGAIAMLRQAGNPYDEVVWEKENAVGLDLGVTGVPETFIVDKNGIIRQKVSYPITQEMWRDEIKPLIDKLEAEPLKEAK